jgi:hydrogenase maturation protease
MVALVVGYGNPLRQDDGLGWHVAEQLGAVPDAGRQVIVCHQLTPELAEPISRADRVVFVDARRGRVAGRVACRVVASAVTGAALSHHLMPGALLALAHALYGACPPAWVVTVDGAMFGHGPDLSPAVAAAIPTVLRHVDARLHASGPRTG